MKFIFYSLFFMLLLTILYNSYFTQALSKSLTSKSRIEFQQRAIARDPSKVGCSSSCCYCSEYDCDDPLGYCCEECSICSGQSGCNFNPSASRSRSSHLSPSASMTASPTPTVQIPSIRCGNSTIISVNQPTAVITFNNIVDCLEADDDDSDSFSSFYEESKINYGNHPSPSPSINSLTEYTIQIAIREPLFNIVCCTTGISAIYNIYMFDLLGHTHFIDSLIVDPCAALPPTVDAVSRLLDLCLPYAPYALYVSVQFQSAFLPTLCANTLSQIVLTVSADYDPVCNSPWNFNLQSVLAAKSQNVTRF